MWVLSRVLGVSLWYPISLSGARGQSLWSLSGTRGQIVVPGGQSLVAGVSLWRPGVVSPGGGGLLTAAEDDGGSWDLGLVGSWSSSALCNTVLLAPCSHGGSRQQQREQRSPKDPGDGEQHAGGAEHRQDPQARQEAAAGDPGSQIRLLLDFNQ
ncbi:hypothetical protein NDU88_005889 [Pleurodeles waltl]|uniref:Uncharacterized protein n=1 Tax=Pleurodeles waltl TaxID=8319 RepID=A0AAV7LQT9_PLEWA|nr:hypothetical protein NDU88_005889 [Pleurodeles waltl]